MRRNLLCVVSLLLVVTTVSFAKGKVREHVKKVIPPDQLEAPYMVPEVLPSPVLSRLAGDPSQGDPIGTTDYDYGWNTGTRQMVESYYPGAMPGTQAQFTYMQRDGLQSGNAARRSVSYVYYNGTTYTAPSPTIPKDTRATGFGDLTVIRSASADGIAMVTSHPPPAAAFNASPGSPAFNAVDIVLPRPAPTFAGDPVSAVKGNSDTIYVITSGDTRGDL